MEIPRIIASGERSTAKISEIVKKTGNRKAGIEPAFSFLLLV